MITAGIVIELALKSLLVAGGVLLLLRLVRARSAAQRSWIAHLGLVTLLALPAAVLLLPSWNPVPLPASAVAEEAEVASFPVKLPYLAAADDPAGAADQAAAPPGETTAAAPFGLPSAGDLAVWVYAIPAFLLLAAMLVAMLRLGGMHRRANVLVDAPWLSALAQAQRRMGFKHGTALLVSKEVRSPVSWGLMRPIILLNEQTVHATREAEAIIAHELAHVARLDWAKLLIARTACALFWFNPLVWLLAREAHQLREEAADDAVLLSEVDSAEYASLLVNAARHDNRALLIAAHGVAPGKDSLKRRIMRVLDVDQARGPASSAWAMLCLAVLLVVATPLAALEPAALAADEVADAGRSGQHGPNAGLIGSSVAATVAAARPELPAEAHAAPAEETVRHSDRDEEIDNLVAYKAVGMTQEYAASIRAAGFSNASMDDLMGAKAVGVTPEFAREMRRMAPDATLEDVVGAKAVGLTPAFVSEMRPIAPGDLEEMVGLAAVGANGAYVREMRALFGALDADEVTGLKAVGVTSEYARTMRALFPRADADDIIEMKAVGVTPEFVREMRRQGLSAETPEAAVEGRLFSQQSNRGPSSLPGPRPMPRPFAAAYAAAPPGAPGN